MKKRLKRIIAAALIFTLIPTAVFAEDETASEENQNTEENISYDFDAYSDRIYQKTAYGDVYERTKTPIEGKEGYYVIGESVPMMADCYVADSEGNVVVGYFLGISTKPGKGGTYKVSTRMGMADSRAGLLNSDFKLIVPADYYSVEVREIGGKLYADTDPSSSYYDLEGNKIENLCKFLIGDSQNETASGGALDCDSWAENDIETALSNGLVPAGLQSNYKAKITREEFCELAVRTYAEKTDGALKWNDEIENPEKPFEDTDNVSVAIAYMLGIVSGTGNNCFSPDSYITRQEAAVMLMNLARIMGADNKIEEVNSFIDESYFADWAYESIYNICGIISDSGTAIMAGTGQNKFSPWFNYQRQQAIVTMERLFETNTDALRDIKNVVRADFRDIADSIVLGQVENSLFKRESYDAYSEKWKALAQTQKETSYIDFVIDNYNGICVEFAFCDYLYKNTAVDKEKIASLEDDYIDVLMQIPEYDHTVEKYVFDMYLYNEYELSDVYYDAFDSVCEMIAEYGLVDRMNL